MGFSWEAKEDSKEIARKKTSGYRERLKMQRFSAQIEREQRAKKKKKLKEGDNQDKGEQSRERSRSGLKRKTNGSFPSMDIFDSLFIFIFHFVYLFWPFIFDIVIDLCMNYNGFFYHIFHIYYLWFGFLYCLCDFVRKYAQL